MQRFRFQLDSVLEWRRTQFELEEAKLHNLLTERAGIQARAAVLDESQSAGRESVKSGSVTPAERSALDEYLRWVRLERVRLTNMLADCDRRTAGQRLAVMNARRNCDLLDKLRAKRQSEWNIQFQRELEQLAAEAHLAKLARE